MTTSWQCESVRLSALWASPDDVSGLLNWEAVTGVQPEQRETQPRLATHREVGTVWDGAILDWRASPGRADWIVAAAIPRDMQLAEIPSLGSIETVIGKFSTLLFDCVATAYRAPRLAFGLVATCPLPTKEASYALLSTMLPSARLEGASEFTYQINRPRKSKSIDGLLINRLSRWTAAAVVGLRMQVTSPGTGPSDGVVSTVRLPLNYTTRVELDINSDADHRTPILADMSRPLFDEFVELSIELLGKGDVP